MADKNCAVCAISIADDEIGVTARKVGERLRNSLVTASEVRQDGLASVWVHSDILWVHTTCRSKYTSQNGLNVIRKRSAAHLDDAPRQSTSGTRLDVGTFNFADYCFVCGEIASDAVEKKQPSLKRRRIQVVGKYITFNLK